MKCLLFCICILVGMQIDANAQIWDQSRNVSYLGFMSITISSSEKKVRAEIYCSVPRTVTFRHYRYNMPENSSVSSYFAVNDVSFSNHTTLNGSTYHTVNLSAGVNRVELGYYIYFTPSSAPSSILWIDDCTPGYSAGEGRAGSIVGMQSYINYILLHLG